MIKKPRAAKQAQTSISFALVSALDMGMLKRETP